MHDGCNSSGFWIPLRPVAGTEERAEPALRVLYPPALVWDPANPASGQAWSSLPLVNAGASLINAGRVKSGRERASVRAPLGVRVWRQAELLLLLELLPSSSC